MEYKKMLKTIKDFLQKNSLPQKNLENNNYSIELIVKINDQTEQSTEIYECDYERKIIKINFIAITTIKKTEAEQNDLSNYALLCGLIQMAATSYKKNKPIYCGFENIKDIETLEYEGLTKAYIELLTSRLLNRTLEENPNYVAMMLAQQLELIVGKEIMLKAFFENDKEVLKRKIQTIDPTLEPKELLKTITKIQKKKSRYEDIQNTQNIFKELFAIAMEKKEKQIDQELAPMQKEVNESESTTNEKWSQGQQYLASIQKTLEMSGELQEEKNYRQRLIRDMYAKFTNSIISKETFDKYIDNWQK